MLISLKKLDFFKVVRELVTERVLVLENPDHSEGMILVVGKKDFPKFQEKREEENIAPEPQKEKDIY